MDQNLPVVQGEIPRDISGAYYRIGPNLKYRPQQGVYGFHMGDGMAYGLYLENGRAHFIRRQTFKQLRASALTEWRELAA